MGRAVGDENAPRQPRAARARLFAQFMNPLQQ
jgi:hypothetical protein